MHLETFVTLSSAVCSEDRRQSNSAECLFIDLNWRTLAFIGGWEHQHNHEQEYINE